MDGKYRRVQVKLNSDIQAKLDYRSGYFGEKDSGSSRQRIRKISCSRR